MSARWVGVRAEQDRVGGEGGRRQNRLKSRCNRPHERVLGPGRYAVFQLQRPEFALLRAGMGVLKRAF